MWRKATCPLTKDRGAADEVLNYTCLFIRKWQVFFISKLINFSKSWNEMVWNEDDYFLGIRITHIVCPAPDLSHKEKRKCRIWHVPAVYFPSKITGYEYYKVFQDYCLETEGMLKSPLYINKLKIIELVKIIHRINFSRCLSIRRSEKQPRMLDKYGSVCCCLNSNSALAFRRHYHDDNHATGLNYNCLWGLLWTGLSACYVTQCFWLPCCRDTLTRNRAWSTHVISRLSRRRNRTPL